jgi:glycerol-3-phosphate dehydrogenase
MPYEKNYTLIGTTDVDYAGNPAEARISQEETDYLCAAYNGAFKNPVTVDDIQWTYSGVRPLYDDGKSASKVTRDFKLYHHKEFKAPLLSLFGGKLTTFREVSERVVNELLYLGSRPGKPWTATEALPGGDIPNRDMKEFIAKKTEQYAWLPVEVLTRYAHSYGTCMDRFLDGARGISDLGRHYGDHVYEAEIVYLVRTEFAQTAEDIFWRRSKMGLHVSEKTMKAVEEALSDFVKKAA